jgi:hypothetical protein
MCDCAHLAGLFPGEADARIGGGTTRTAKCVACAAVHNATVMKMCGAQYMVEKACGQAGGFPQTSGFPQNEWCHVRCTHSILHNNNNM